MPTALLRPDSTIDVYHGSYWSTTGGSYEAVLSDNNDGSSAHCSVTPGAPGGQYIRMGLGMVPGIDRFTQYRSVRAWGRGVTWFASANLWNNCAFEVRSGGSVASTTGYVTQGWVIVSYAGNTATTRPDGQPWTQADIDSLEAWAWPRTDTQNSTNSSVRIYDLWAEVVYNMAPRAAVTAAPEQGPTASLSWTYTDPEGDTQQYYRVRAFDRRDAILGNFDPNNWGPLYDSGAIASAATTHNLSLPNGDYRVFVAVADNGSNGRFGPFNGVEMRIRRSGSWGML